MNDFSWDELNQSSSQVLEKKIDNSSTIEYIKYDPTFKALTICFKGSKDNYTYFDVPVDVYRNLVDADSAGKYFAQNVKKSYTFSKKAGSKKKDESTNNKK